LSRRAVLLAVAAGWPGRQAGTRAASPPDELVTETEWHIRFLTNQQRDIGRLPPLEGSPALADVARAHSRDMLARGFFDHRNPDGLGPRDRVVKHGLSFKVVAENIYSARNGSTDAAELASIVVGGWMKSEGHRLNILDPSLKLIGVGVAVADRDVMATQLFAA
jgi:uncharacterized protein YkwD